MTLSRTLSDTFAGIARGAVPAFLLAQLAGAALAVATVRFLYPDIANVAPAVVLPHAGGHHSPSQEIEGSSIAPKEVRTWKS